MNEMVACRGCGKQIHRTALRCPQCGASQLRRRYKSKLAAGLLAIFLGGFGVHRFYLGQWWGLFYLLLFWTFIPGFIALVEGIVFLASNEDAWDNKYNDGISTGESGSGALVVVIALVAGLFVVIPVIGILAAIAIPAYQDFTLRAKAAGALAQGQQAQAWVEEYTATHQAWPAPGTEIALPPSPNGQPVATARVLDNGVVELSLPQLAGRTENNVILLEPDISEGYFSWSCSGGTLEARYRPIRCRK